MNHQYQILEMNQCRYSESSLKLLLLLTGTGFMVLKKYLKEKPETSVIILDDGFQHRRITPGFSILLSDFDRLMIRDHLLPYGNLRESLHNMRRADIILITKSPEKISPIQRRMIVKEINKAPYQNLYFTSLKYHRSCSCVWRCTG